MRLAPAALLSCVLCAACASPPAQTPADQPKAIEEAEKVVRVVPAGPAAPRKIILMIGDGMGNPITSAAAYAKGEPLSMQQMSHIGFIRTHEFEFVTTDSAASATAFATGHKAHYESVSVTPGTTKAEELDPAHHLENTVTAAKAAGWRTGLVATSRIVHATPAAFAAHREHRQSYDAIAQDMAKAGVDVLLGAGTQYFNARKDGLDLIADMTAQGYAVARTPEEIRAQSKTHGKLLGLLHDKDMPSMQEGGRAMSLAELTDAALTSLDNTPDSSFFLMVEGSQIDWEEHDMDGQGAVAETLDFDSAVAVARRYAAAHPDALVIVTADHETGGVGLIDTSIVEHHARILGGLPAANAATQYAAPRPAGPETTQLMALGEGALKPAELADARLAITFGYLSAASRPLWKQANEFLATHTASMVPLYAEGAGAEIVAGLRDNAELGAFIIDHIKGKPLPAAPVAQPGRPKNVILLVGDGMGLAAVTTSYYARGESAMLGMPVTGLVSTHGADRLVNDSAATATALSTGQRTRYGAVGTAPGSDGKLVAARTVLEAAEARGLKTGLVTTTQLTHATPAAFYAHEGSRGKTADIAAAFVDMPARIQGADGVDVAFAGGAGDFNAALSAKLAAQGVVVERGWASPQPAGKRVVRLMAKDGLDDASKRLAGGAQPTLAAMASEAMSALDALDAEDKGFFLMVEGGQIDWALHEQEQGPRLLHEIEDFDRAVAAALAFAERDGDTLVIVTADHDHTLSLLDTHYGFKPGHCGVMKQCGGARVFPQLPVALDKIDRGEGLLRADLQHEWAPPMMMLQYGYLIQASRYVEKKTAGPHAAHMVPLFARGPGAALFGAYHDQPAIGQLLMKWALGE
jgi:alkaline phosphatase